MQLKGKVFQYALKGKRKIFLTIVMNCNRKENG